MDAELTTLISAAAGATGKLLVTDAWEVAKRALAGLWRQFSPAQADAVAADLEPSTDLSAEDLATEWRLRLTRLLTAHPEAADQLRQILVDTLEPAAVPPGSTTITGYATDQAKLFQAGRDMHIRDIS
jgi:hypothetical protein